MNRSGEHLMGRKRTRTKITLATAETTVIRDRLPSFLRNAVVAPIEVDNPEPEQPGDKIIAFRSLRDDPLARMHCRRQIDEAQYSAGRAYQRDFETAERGPRAIDPSKEAVDGGRAPEPLTDSQLKAVERLKQAAKALGTKGRGITHDFLIMGMSVAQIAQARGQSPGRFTLEYYGGRVRECLEELAIVYNFAMRR